MSLRLAVSGATGRMGHTILELAAKDPRFEIVGALESPTHASLGRALAEVLPGVASKAKLAAKLGDLSPRPQVLIDFTQPQGTLGYLQETAGSGIGMVIGTTGLKDDEKKKVQDASKSIPIVMATNMSVGMNLLFALVEEAAAKLGPAYDIEIIEAHHHFKKDAPSGSALSLGEAAARGRKVDLKTMSTHGREGLVGERQEGTIGFHAVRGGDIVGDHRVLFAGPGERLELTHIAHSRDAFAQGALQAALFLDGKKSGLYDMQNVLGIK
ncbi:MAG TPA: 4-hydroxy-tetrahydrodipicolinate reductase [bacterium]|nr:4-hydroxy-tetrahydrodipicolinate reductase [bacterium]